MSTANLYGTQHVPAMNIGASAVIQVFENGVRSMNPTYHMMGQQVTVASLASSSTAEELRSRPPTMHTAGAQVRGAATYRAPGR